MRRRVLFVGCGLGALSVAAYAADGLNTIAEKYAHLVLALGQHDADYVDAFYGPAEWKTDAARRKIALGEMEASAARLRPVIRAGRGGGDELAGLRRESLRRQLDALRARVRMLQGAKLTFDEESQALYDAVAPTHPESFFEEILAEIDRALPGTAPLVERYDAF